MRKRSLFTALALLLCLLGLLPAYLRAMTVSGPSDAPTLLLGDQVLVNLAAYRVNVPYSGVALWQRQGPRRGDMVLFDVPNRSVLGLKRVIGLPGDTVEVRENAVILNGHPLARVRLDRAAYAPWLGPIYRLGEMVEQEASRYAITYSPGLSPLRNSPALTVPAGYYFLLGDHRDNSNDSRVFGPLAQRHIHGRVIAHLHSDRPPAMLPVW